MLAFALLLPALLSAEPTADARCEGAPTAAAARFSAKALKGKSPQERYAAYVQACALPRITTLASALIAFPTVGEQVPAGKSEAFAGMETFLATWAKQSGLSLKTYPDRGVFELTWGKGAPLMSWVFHGDVVPAPRGEWKRDPFVAVVEGGRLYGRGAEDDKGPLAAGMVAMAMAKELGLSPGGKVLVVIGNGEESGWEPMATYAKQVPKPAYVISVDSEFPLMTAQSGFVAWYLDADVGTAPADAPPLAPLAVDARAGEFLTQVPGTASVTLTPRGETATALAAKVKTQISELTKTRPTLKAKVDVVDGNVVVSTQGVAVHSSVAHTGQNALWDLAALSDRLKLAPNGVQALLSLVAARMDGDHWAGKLGMAYEDPLMGGLLVAPTLLRVEKGKATLSVNMRRPRGQDATAFGVSLSQATARAVKDSGGRIREGEKPYIGDPHTAELEGTLASTLLDIYRRHQNAPDAKAGFIRGGTYARLFPGAVDFGPALPGEQYTGHAPDESIALSTLSATAQMLAEALYVLALKAGAATAARTPAP